MARRRFEFEDGGSAKFWEIEQVGSELHIAWGKLGAKGQSQVKGFASEAKAGEAAHKLIKEKTGKGYVERENAGDADTDAAVALTVSPAEEPKAEPAPKATKKASKKSDAASVAGAAPSADGVTLPNGKPLGARAVSNLVAKLDSAADAGEFGNALFKAASYEGSRLLGTLVQRGLFRPKTNAQLSWMKSIPAEVPHELQEEMFAAVETTPLDGVTVQELLLQLQSLFEVNPTLLSAERRRRPLRDACVLVSLLNDIEVPEQVAREGQDTILGWLGSIAHWGPGTDESRAAAVLAMCDPKAVRAHASFQWLDGRLRTETLRAGLASGPLDLGADPGLLPQASWQHVFSVRKDPASAFFGTGQIDLTNEGLRRASSPDEVPVGEESVFFTPEGYSRAIPELALVGAKNAGALEYARNLLMSAPGFLLGGAIWLQGGKDGADPNFLAQYDERLAPGVNLGDTGICYSFEDRAEWQCL